jgi:hypothetical protein
VYRHTKLFPVFPRLVFLKEVTFNKKSGNKTSNLYKLDWDDFDAAMLEEHKKWNEQYWPNQVIPIVQKFDPYYESILQSLRFAVPTHYLDEIHRVSEASMSEFHKERHFDTVMREVSYKPAISFVEVAFRLLCDCAYDEETNYYYRANNKYLLPHLLLFRFWQHQTGSACITEHADFQTLEGKLKFLNESIADYDLVFEEKEALEKFLSTFKSQVERVQQCRSSLVTTVAGSTVITDKETMELKEVIKHQQEGSAGVATIFRHNGAVKITKNFKFI